MKEKVTRAALLKARLRPYTLKTNREGSLAIIYRYARSEREVMGPLSMPPDADRRSYAATEVRSRCQGT